MTQEELERRLQKEYDRVISDTYKRLKKDKPITRAKLHKALLRANRLYWIGRLKLIDEFFVASTEQAAAILTVPYMSAAQEFSKQVKQIYGNYTSAFNLTQKDADNLLKTVKYDRTIMSQLQAVADKLPAGEEKDKILAQIAAPAYRYRIQRADLMAQKVAETCKSIVSGEVLKDKAVLQAQIEQSFNLTLEGIAGKKPAETILKEIGNKPPVQTVAPTAYKEIQDFTVTKERGILDSFTGINEKAVNKIVNHTWHGENFSSRIWEHTDQVAEEIKKVLLKGELTGASIDKMTTEIQQRFEVGAYQARRLIRTEANYCQNQATMQGYIEANIERYQYLAMIDDRTSEICTDLDGEIFFVKDAKVGVNYPPMHPNCRSTTIPVMKTAEEIEREIDADIDSWNIPDGMSFDDYVTWQTDEALKRRENNT